MILLNHCLVQSARPIKILATDKNEGSRIGGNRPEGITPARVDLNTRYFATVDLDELSQCEISIFVNLRYDWDNPNSLYRQVSRIFSTEEFVQLVVHQKSKRSKSTDLASELPGRALVIDKETADMITEPGGELLVPNKIGGRPYFFYNEPNYITSVTNLIDQGFNLFLQLSWGGYEREVPFAWPFDQYTFHLLARQTPEGIEWRYGWG